MKKEKKFLHLIIYYSIVRDERFRFKYQYKCLNILIYMAKYINILVEVL